MQLSKWPISRRRRCPCGHLVWQQGCGSVWPHCMHSQHLRHVLVFSAKEDSSAVHGTGDETMTSAEMGMPCEQRTLIRPTAFHSTSDKSTLWLPHLYMGCCWMVTELHVGLNQKHGADDGNRRTVLLSLLWAMCMTKGCFQLYQAFFSAAL